MNSRLILPPIRDVMQRHALTPLKGLGQNFLSDANLLAKIAREAYPLEGEIVWEVGPGPGGLTRALLQAGASVIAIEQDHRCIAALAELSNVLPGKLEIIHNDALSYPEEQKLSQPAIIVANLPYHIGTPLILKWLEKRHLFKRWVLLLQKEVVDRLTAVPGTKEYGRLSILVQWLCVTEWCFDIPPQAFIPPPKVTSSVVRITPRPQPLFPAKQQILEHLTQITFSQRRKMLRVSLKSIIPSPESFLETIGIDPTSRPETLSIELWCRLAREIAPFLEKMK